jgi:ataxin-3
METSREFPRGYVYFEKQSDDRLCGMHCINSLLQGPFFDLVSLSEIGQYLDREEQLLLGNQNPNYNNVDLSGNYNIQVLTQALNNFGCEVIGLKTNEAISLLEKNTNFEALIFNSSNHWFSIRKIDGIWFNLNSTNSLPGPEIISDFYLEAFIKGAEDIGYTNFLVKNLPRLPFINSETYQNLQAYQKLVSYEDIIKAKNLKIENRKKREEEENKKFKPFSGKGYTVDQYSNYDELNNIEGFDDDEMKQAYQLSLIEYSEQLKKEIPPEPKNGYSLHINYNGRILHRIFSGDNKIGDIIKYVKSEIPTFAHVQIFENFPEKIFYDNEEMLIKDSGLGFNQMLMAKIIN